MAEQMEVERQIRITDVNNDCLEKVFKYLEFKDLLNVAVSNAQLRGAAKLAFTAEYRLQSFHVVCTEPEEKILHRKIENLKMGLQALRCFGDQISHLEISCIMDAYNIDIHFQRLLGYVSEYCAASLTNITVNRCPIRAWNQVQTQFKNVRKVHMNNSSVDGQLINRLFPNMQCLSLGYLCTINPLVNLNHHYPNLDRIEIFAKTEDCFREVHKTDAFKSFFQLNPQIRSLKIPFMSHSYSQHVTEYLTSLQNLELIFTGEGSDTDTDQKQQLFKNVERFKMYNKRSGFPVIPIVFDQLKEFSIQAQSLEDNEELYRFLSVNSMIQHLTIKHNMAAISERNLDVMQLVFKLPMLIKLDLSFWKFAPDKAVYVMKQLKHLKLFYFTLYTVSEYKAIEAKVSPEWKGSRPFVFNSVYKFVREY